VGKVAVVGMFANLENTGDRGGSDAKTLDPELVITPFEGIATALEGTGATASAFRTVAGNEAAVGAADVVLVVTGYYPADLGRGSSGEEGEGKDRVSLQLPQRDLDNLTAALALKAARPALKLVVAMKSGGAVVVAPWVGQVDALLMVWFGGVVEGTALAELLFGDVNPGGRLVQSFPVSESDLPAFRNDTSGEVPYDYYHGYRWLERKGVKPQYAFGWGLSYTTFGFSNLTVAQPSLSAADTLSVTVDVTNTGPRAGTAVAQLYVGYDGTAVKDQWGRPVKDLRAFARVADLAPGEKRTVTLAVKAADLGYWDSAAHAFKVEKMSYQLYVGPSSDLADPNVLRATFSIR
jgi:beta-glucosidase